MLGIAVWFTDVEPGIAVWFYPTALMTGLIPTCTLFQSSEQYPYITFFFKKFLYISWLQADGSG